MADRDEQKKRFARYLADFPENRRNLALDGEPLIGEPYRERRRQLETLELDTRHVQIVPMFSDGEALFDAMCEGGLEGVVAKRGRDRYRPGERLWVKTKNRATPRFAEELAGVSRVSRAREGSTART